MDKPAVDIGQVIDESSISGLQKTVFWLCGLVALLDGFDTQAVAFAVPLIAKEWNLPLPGFGVVFGAGLLGICLGSLFIAPLADRWGRKPVICACVGMFGALAMATVLAHDVRTLAICRLLTGLGLGGAMPNLIALVAEYAPQRKRALLVTASFCGFPLGGALGGLLSAALAPKFGWPVIFALGGMLPLALLPFLLLWLRESPRFLHLKGGKGAAIAGLLNRISSSPSRFAETQRFSMSDALAAPSSQAPLKTLFADGMAMFTVLIWGVFFCSLLVMYFLFSWLPSVLERSGLPLAIAINAAVILNLGGIVGGLLIGKQVDRLGPKRVLVFSYALGALAVIGLGMGAGAAVVLACSFFAGVFIIGSQFAMNALAAGSYPTSARSTGVGWALGVGRVGSVVGPLIGSALVDGAVAVQTVFLWAALPAALATAFLLILRPKADSTSHTRVAVMQ